MKNVSQEYIDNEESTQRKPVEIYHVWNDRSDEHWRYTDGDTELVYDENTYTPAAISRGSVKFNVQLDVTTLNITTNHLQEPTINFLSVNPVEILWISIMKLHRDQNPLEADVVFIGQIKDVGFKGIEASVKCVGFEHFLKKTIPIWRYQLTCNHQVFDSLCGLDEDDYKTTATVTLDETGTILTAVEFRDVENGYFTGGEVRFGPESRTIVAHYNAQITIMYAMTELVDFDSVDAFAGCDQRAETCRDKYDNILQFLGAKDIPIENPATRVSW